MTKLGLQLTFAALTFAGTEAITRPKPNTPAPAQDPFAAAPEQEKARPALEKVAAAPAKKGDGVTITIADKCECKCDCGKTGACKCKAGACPCDCGCAKGKPCSCNDGWYQATEGSWYYLRAGKIIAAFDPTTGKYYRKDKAGEWGPWEDDVNRGERRIVQPATRSSRSC